MMDKSPSLKIREFPEKNYRAIYYNYKTIRQQYDASKPILELDYPEFYDIKITNKCDGNCPWCYQDSIQEGDHYIDAIEKIDSFFGSMTKNQKPFQVAIGGGEPTLHPEFIKILERFDYFGITPNYTTNAMHIDSAIIEATRRYCGGIAISCHEHLENYWKPMLPILKEENLKVNLHIIISDKESVDRFLDIFNKYKRIVDYFVLLPHIAQGRATSKELQVEYLFNKIDKLSSKQVAFGALFYPYLKKDKNRFDISLYEPEIMSKYLDLKDMKLYKSSFDLEQSKDKHEKCR